MLQEEDYLEAELDSTDTLKPKTNELHGEGLLRDKYLLVAAAGAKRTNAAAAASKVTPARRDDDERAPPGTVPQSAGSPLNAIYFLSAANSVNYPSVSSAQLFAPDLLSEHVHHGERPAPTADRGQFKVGR